MGHHSRKLELKSSDGSSARSAASFMKENRRYWEDPQTVSLLDRNLRRLEEKFVLSRLKSEDSLADVGCGDAISTLRYARKVKSCTAIEQSGYLYSRAVRRFRRSGLENTRCENGSVLDLSLYRESFDAVVTQRVLINLPDWSHQMAAIRQIHASLRQGGHYLMIENTYEGHELLNQARRSVGLNDIPIHWHNVFFHHDRLVTYLRRLFVMEEHHTFDVYYLLTRVFANMFARFEGFGRHAAKDPIFDTVDKAAADLYEKAGQTMKLGGRYAFGPIQGFVLRKRSL